MEQLSDRIWQLVALAAGSLLSFFMYKQKRLDSKLDGFEMRMNHADISQTKHEIHIADLKDDMQDLKKSVNTATQEIKDLLIQMAKTSGRRNKPRDQ